MARASRSIMGVCWRVPGLLPAFAVAWLAAACGFKSPPASGIDVPGDSSVDAPGDTADAPARAWLSPWSHRKPITLLASQIRAPGGGALTDFPVLVSLTDPDIAAAARADGADTAFTAADGTTRLAGELESFTPDDQKLVAWVKVPSLSTTVDTTIFVYYGNPDPPPPPQAPETVWTADYLGVWHLDQDPANAGSIRDSTGHLNGTANNMISTDRAPAQIGQGLSFDGVDSYLSLPMANLGNTFTISMWVNYKDQIGTTASGRTLLANSDRSPDSNGFRFFINSISTSNRRLIFETGTGAPNSGRMAETADGAVPASKFAHVAAVVNRAAQSALLYIDGVLVNPTATSTALNFQNNSDFNVGRRKNGTVYLAGTLDQIEIATVLRSPEWLQTVVNNQAQPSAFHAVGPEEAAP